MPNAQLFYFFSIFSNYSFMKEIDFISSLHKSTKRDYLARVNDKNSQR